MISSKTSDCHQKHRNYACNAPKLTALIRELWRQQRRLTEPIFYGCRQICGGIDCKQRFYARKWEKQNTILTIYGAGRTDTVEIYSYGVRLTPYQAGTMCATVPLTADLRLTLWGLHTPNPPVKGDDVYGARCTNIRPADG